MKNFFKFIGNIILFVLSCGILLTALITANGYNMYKQAISKTSLVEKVNQIQSDGNYVELEELPEIYINAVIAVEDHRFFNHSGIDFISTARAVVNNILSSSLSEGGSTITQQLSKNLYFTQEKHFTRKVAELFLAFDLEREYNKNDILELYINTIYYGDGYNGIRQASNGYYKKEPALLTDFEATLLAGVPNAPSVYAPTKNMELALQRQKQVLNAMIEHEYLSEYEAFQILESKK